MKKGRETVLNVVALYCGLSEQNEQINGGFRRKKCGFLLIS